MKSELEVLQRIENGVWRTMLGSPGYAPVSTLQGEVGASGDWSGGKRHKTEAELPEVSD